MPTNESGLWVPNLSPKQMEVYNCKDRYVLVTGPRLCVAPSTRVFTPRGLVSMGSIHSEPMSALVEVTGYDGRKADRDTVVRRVRNTDTHGVTLELVNGFRITCSFDHPIWCCYQQSGETKVGFLKAADIVSGLHGGVYLPLVGNSWSGDQNPVVDVHLKHRRCTVCGNPVIRARGLCGSHYNAARMRLKLPPVSTVCDKVEITPEVAWFIGALVGDGSTSIDDKVKCIGFSGLDLEINDRVARVCESLGGRMMFTDRCNFRITGEKIRQLVRALGLACRSREKRIPEAILSGGRKVLAAFLTGLFDTDGYAEKDGCVGITCTSEGLMRDTQEALAAFGILSVLGSRTTKCQTGATCFCWRLSLMGSHARMFFDEIGFSLPRKHSRRNSRASIPHHYGYPPHIRQVIRTLKRSIKGKDRAWWRKHRYLGSSNTLTPCPEKAERIRAHFPNGTAGLESFDAITAHECWVKVGSATPRETTLVDITTLHHNSYIIGGHPCHNSGKTVPTMHRLISHAWETPDARIGMFTKTIKAGKGGVWSDLTGFTMKEWLDAGLVSEDGKDFGYTKQPGEDKNRAPGPRIDGSTRMHYFTMRNYWGGESRIELHSLDFDDDIAEKLLNTRFSCIYFAELQNFHSRSVFDLSIQQLRNYGLPYECHQWISDTNPPEEGIDHFAYEIWYRERVMESFPEYCRTDDDRTRFRRRQAGLKLFEFGFEDNPFVDPQQIADLKATYWGKADEYDRFVLGKWTKTGRSGRWFPGFKPELHVIGQAEGPDPETWDYLNPSRGCTTLYASFDTGSVNHAAAILEKTITKDGQVQWSVLDEMVSLKEEMLLTEFMELFMEKVVALEEHIGRKVRWVCWSDNSLEAFRATNPQTEAAIVEEASHGRFRLQFAYEAKSPNAMRKRLQLVSSMISANQIKVSAHCTYSIQMFRELCRPNNRNTNLLIPRGEPNKHIWDAISYCIYSEYAEEFGESKPDEGRRSSVIEVEL